MRPASPVAAALAEQGIEVVAGDFDDPTSLRRAMDRVDGVFSVQNFTAGTDAELRHGVALAQAAASAGVPQFVYSSVDGAQLNTGIAFHKNKFHIEERIGVLGLPSTIFRPVFFMDNWSLMRQAIFQGFLPAPLRRDSRLQQLAIHDLATLVADAFESPQSWIGRVTDLAGDELTMDEIAGTFARVTGKPVHYQQLSWQQWRDVTQGSTDQELGEDHARMFRWLDAGGPDFDVAGLRDQYPQLTNFEVFLRETGWETHQ
jgi:uncharacterized protein YbjT (DUF2867 family)